MKSGFFMLALTMTLATAIVARAADTPVQPKEFLQLLKSPDATLRQKALGQLDEDLMTTLESDPAAMRAIVEAVDDPVPFNRKEAIKVLGALHGHNEPALPAVIKHLTDSDVEVARLAALQLSNFAGDKQAAIPILVEILANSEVKRRQAAVCALGEIGDPSVLSLLKGRLADSESWVRLCTIMALNKIGMPETESLKVFSSMLADADPGVRDEAAKALKPYGSQAKDSVGLLVAHLESCKGKECQYTLELLGALGPDAKAALPFLEKAMKDPEFNHKHVGLTLWQIGQRADLVVPNLIDLLKSKNDEEACDILAEIGPAAKDAVPALIDAMQKRDWDLQWAAAGALAGIGPAAAPAIPALINAMLNEGGMVPGSCCDSLGKIGPSAVDPLREALRTATKHRDYILDALAKIGPPAKAALPEIKACFGDTKDNTGFWAAIAYCAIDPTSIEPRDALIDALSKASDPFTKLKAALALGEMGPNGVLALPALKAIHDEILTKLKNKKELSGGPLIGMITGQRGDMPDLELLIGAAIAIARIEKSAAVVPILKFGLNHDQPIIIANAAKACGALGPHAKEVLPLLEKLSEHKDEQVRLAVRDAIQKIRE